MHALFVQSASRVMFRNGCAVPPIPGKMSQLHRDIICRSAASFPQAVATICLNLKRFPSKVSAMGVDCHRDQCFFFGRNEDSLQNIFVGHMKPPSRRWQRHRKWFQTILNQCSEPIYLLDVVVTFHLRRC